MASYQMRQRDPLLDQNMQAALEKRGKELLGGVLLLLGVLVALMLASYSPDDPSFLAATDQPAQNMLGRIGAAIASPLNVIAGHGAWGIAICLIAWGTRFVTHRGEERALGRVIFAPIGIALMSIYASTLVPGPDWHHSFGLGGLFGDTILGALIEGAPVQAGFGLKLMSLVVGGGVLGVGAFVCGFDRQELQTIWRFIVLGSIILYSRALVLAGRGADASLRAAQSAAAQAAEKARQRRALQRERQAEAAEWAAAERAVPVPAAGPRPMAQAATGAAFAAGPVAAGAAELPSSRRLHSRIQRPSMVQYDDDAPSQPELWDELPVDPAPRRAAPVLRAEPRYPEPQYDDGYDDEPLVEDAWDEDYHHEPAPARGGLLSRVPGLMRRLAGDDEPEPELVEPRVSRGARNAEAPTEDRIRARIADAVKNRDEIEAARRYEAELVQRQREPQPAPRGALGRMAAAATLFGGHRASAQPSQDAWADPAARNQPKAAPRFMPLGRAAGQPAPAPSRMAEPPLTAAAAAARQYVERQAAEAAARAAQAQPAAPALTAAQLARQAAVASASGAAAAMAAARGRAAPMAAQPQQPQMRRDAVMRAEPQMRMPQAAAQAPARAAAPQAPQTAQGWDMPNPLGESLPAESYESRYADEAWEAEPAHDERAHDDRAYDEHLPYEMDLAEHELEHEHEHELDHGRDRVAEDHDWDGDAAQLRFEAQDHGYDDFADDAEEAPAPAAEPARREAYNRPRRAALPEAVEEDDEINAFSDLYDEAEDSAQWSAPAPARAEPRKVALSGVLRRKAPGQAPAQAHQPQAAAPAAPRPRQPVPVLIDYEAPPLALLTNPATIERQQLSDEALEENARTLESVLEDYGVKGEIVSVRPGPVVTMYELEPAPGLKASRVIGLADDIARSMSALSARVSTVPGRSVIGIELPNAHREKVVLREILSDRDFGDSNMRLPLALGKDIAGEPLVANLAKMPHLLIAGTTGSGKSVAINTMILSLLYKLTPEECRLIMIDPKMLELSVYDGIPHLLSPVVTDPKKAVVALKWVVGEMEERYRKMSKMGVRNIEGYNGRVKEALSKGEMFKRTVQTGFDEETGDPVFETEELMPKAIPYIVVIVDEMADLMMVAGKEIEACIQRLAQMARASGIHLIMATQRPSVDVITGTIKANFPTRISFQVTSKIDSRTILGEQGAEQLLGMGDMLYMAGGSRITRIHGPFVSDEEVEEIVTHLKSFGPPEYMSGVVEGPDEDKEADIDAVLGLGGNSDNAEEALYDQAVAVVLRDRKVSTSYIQRKLGIGYNKAARLVEQMEEQGLVSAANHVGKREILVPEE